MITIEQMVSMKVPVRQRISPDGQSIAYAVAEASKSGEHPRSDIWLTDRLRGRRVRLTSGPWEDASSAWSPDGRHIAFTSDRQKPGVAQLYVLSIEGGESVQLTSHPEPVSDPEWSPDGRMLAFLACDLESAEQKRRRDERDDGWVVGEDPRQSHLWIVELDGGAASVISRGDLLEPRRVTPPTVHVGSMFGGLYDWAPDSAGFVAILAASPKIDDLWFAELAMVSLDGATRSLGAFAGLFTRPKCSPGGEWVAFIASGEPPMTIGVPYVIPAAGGEARALAIGGQGSANGLSWLPDGRRLLVNLVESLRGEIHIASIDDDDARVAFTIEGEAGTVVQDPSVSADGQEVAFIRSDVNHGPEVWHGTVGGTASPMTDLNPWIGARPAIEARDLSWKSVDGLEIYGLLMLPAGYQDGARYPMLTHIHGGPMGAWTRRFYASWHDWALPMAERGFAVLLPNPRGSSGRGVDFLAANQGDLGGREWDDIMSGIDEVIRLGVADPDRLVVGGWSYGGFFTSWAITHTDRFKAAVSGAGISNWVSFNGTTDVRRIFESYFSSTLIEQGDGHWERSPVRYLGRAATPTLVIHGEDDLRVPISQSQELYEGLRDAGVETRFVVYPREAHGIAERHHQRDMLERVLAWYDMHLNGAPHEDR